jgi:hypothetical protein
MPNEEVTTDYADGFRAGFQVARTELQMAALKAMEEGRSVMKAMNKVDPPVLKRRLDQCDGGGSCCQGLCKARY